MNFLNVKKENLCLNDQNDLTYKNIYTYFSNSDLLLAKRVPIK